MILDENESNRLLEKIQKYSTADSVVLTLRGGNTYNLRFAVNSVTTNGFSDSLSVTITSNFGKKVGTVTLNKFDDESIQSAVFKSEQIARLSPDNKEFMTPLTPQTYMEAKNYSPNTENLKSNDRASYLSYIIDESVKNNVISAGYFENSTNFTATKNSNGLFVYNKNTIGGLSSTVRTKDGTGSGRFEKQYVNIKKLDYKPLSDWVTKRSLLSRNPAEIKPGHYTVILESSAVADMVSLCLAFMNSRSADEGRSFFSKSDGGNKIGEELVSKKVLLYSDPADDHAPSITFTSEGLPRNKAIWFEDGILKNLHRNRFWAEKTGSPAIAFPSNLVMAGSNKSLDKLISETDYAILVTRFWYIRTVEPRTMLLTGLTRDGVVEIKAGK
ncbi:MAG TPA: metallopeptidase TldD-related protein, partial [Ignavibacteria bacterium]